MPPSSPFLPPLISGRLVTRSLQLASNPLILSMCISHIRSASKPGNDKVFLNRWKLYHAAMTTIITRLDAKTLEARKGQAGPRQQAAYMDLLQEIAFHAHCKQMKDLNGEVLRWVQWPVKYALL